MILYDRLWETMKEKGISQYSLIKNYHINEAQLHRLRKNMVVKTTTLDRLCEILDCEVQDICQYVKKSASNELWIFIPFRDKFYYCYWLYFDICIVVKDTAVKI